MRSCELAQPAFWWWRPRATRERPSRSTLPRFPRPSRSERQRRTRRSPATRASAAGSSSPHPSVLRSPRSAAERMSAARPRSQARSSRGSWRSFARRRRSRPLTSSRPPSHEPRDRFREAATGSWTPRRALAALGRPEPHLQPAVVGDPVVGESLEAFSGVWSGAGLTATYQWERCQSSCAPIDGSDLVPLRGHARRRRVRASGRRLPPTRRARRPRPRPRSSSRHPGFESVPRSSVARGWEPCSPRGQAPGRARIFASRPPGSAAGACAPRSSRERGTAYEPRIAATGSESRCWHRTRWDRSRRAASRPPSFASRSTRSRGTAPRAPRSARSPLGDRPRAP